MPKRLIQRPHAHHIRVNKRFLEGILLYNILVYSIIVGCYHYIDFDTHFEMPDHTPKATTGAIMYYAFLVHTGVMAGEIVPKTKLGRGLLAIHVLFSWGLIMILMAPWSAL